PGSALSVTPEISTSKVAERVVKTFQKKGPPKSFSKSVMQAAEDVGLTPEQIAEFRTRGDTRGLLVEIQQRVQAAQQRGVTGEAFDTAEGIALDWDRDTVLRMLGLTQDDYYRMVVERAGYYVTPEGT